MNFLTRISLVGLLMSVAACGSQEPLRIGFIGGLSDRNSDMGPAGLNAVQLAIDQVNRTGGIHGRSLELVVKDDAQNGEAAARGAKELVEARVDAVVGPFTSSMAEVAVPILDKAGIFEVSPTVTSMDFFGKDDNLFRINHTTRDNAREYAGALIRRGQKRIAVAYDLRNRSFTTSWLKEFSVAVTAGGGRLVAEVSYESAESTDFAAVIRQMLLGKPDCLFFVSPAVDVARLAQEARLQAPKLPLGASEWAATEQLAKLGGSGVDGLLIIQNFDREDSSPRYREFVETYQQRYQRAPGYTAVMSYDAMTVIVTALRNRKPGESLKAAAQRSGPYQGLQQSIQFDHNGDTRRLVVFTELHGGRFLKIKP